MLLATVTHNIVVKKQEECNSCLLKRTQVPGKQQKNLVFYEKTRYSQNSQPTQSPQVCPSRKMLRYLQKIVLETRTHKLKQKHMKAIETASSQHYGTTPFPEKLSCFFPQAVTTIRIDDFDYLTSAALKLCFPDIHCLFSLILHMTEAIKLRLISLNFHVTLKLNLRKNFYA